MEVRAELFSIALSDIGSLESAEISLEQDPLDEEILAPRRAPKTRRPKNVPDEPTLTPVTLDDQATEAGESIDSTAAIPMDDNSALSPDEQLFGVLWPLLESVKLDPTVDRNQFRQQRDRLKALGYAFKPIGQIWVKS